MKDADPRPTAMGGDARFDESAEDLYENAPCGYLSTRPDGTIVRVNATFLDWTGLARDDLVGRRRFQDLLTPGGRIYHETHYSPLLQMQDAVREIALEIVCADGRRLPVLVNSTLRRDADGRPKLVRTTVFNATDRHRYERELLAARDRVERLQHITAALAATLTPEEIAEVVVADLVDGGVVDGAVVELSTEGTGEATILAARGAPVDPTDVLPLVIEGRTIGALRVAGSGGEAAPGEVGTLLAAVATQCAGALDRARLRVAGDHAAERWARLAQVSRRLAEAAGPAARATLLVDSVVPRLADWAVVEIAGADGPTVLAGRRPPGHPVDAERQIELPLGARSGSLGTLALGREATREPFAALDLPFLADLAERGGLALEIALLLEQQQGIAHALQASLLAQTLPEDPRMRIATAYLPGVEELEVGGDWYDAFRIGPDRIGVVVGDVVGRGLDAAITMGQLRSAIRTLAANDHHPAALLQALDRFAAQIPSARWATVVYGEIDLARGMFCFACAAHPPPLVVPPGAPAGFAWEARSAPVDAFEGHVARGEHEIDLPPGSRILLYTDGLVEVRGEVIDEGFARLARETDARSGAPLPEFVSGVSQAMLAVQAAPDDVCMLCVEMATGD